MTLGYIFQSCKREISSRYQSKHRNRSCAKDHIGGNVFSERTTAALLVVSEHARSVIYAKKACGSINVCLTQRELRSLQEGHAKRVAGATSR